MQTLDLYYWHNAVHLPSPGVPLVLKLSDGAIVPGIRPSYIEKRSAADLGYEDLQGNALLNVTKWAIR